MNRATLTSSNRDLLLQNFEIEKQAAELIIVNKELVYQNQEKEKRAAELTIANINLVYQNQEKEKRAAELVIANKELEFQNIEKEKRAAELVIANQELEFQNQEKENRASELAIANTELEFQNKEKEKRAAELIIANQELEQITYIASHDLQEPLRTVSNYMQVFEEEYLHKLDDKARKYLLSVNNATKRMSILLSSLLDFSRLGIHKNLKLVDTKHIVLQVIDDLAIMIKTSNAVIEIVGAMPTLNVYETEIRQLFQNLISNAIKFCKRDKTPCIQISANNIGDTWHFSVKDTGIGVENVYFERIFDIFQRLHANDQYEGNGIGLANCKKIVHLHQGEIWLESAVGHGTTFYFTIPNLTL